MTSKLNLEWNLSCNSLASMGFSVIPARVPGNVIGDLLRNKIIKDPYISDNSDKIRSWEYEDWVYETEFSVPEHAESERLYLVFDGIDTVSEIFIDDLKVGESKNMFISHRFEITDLEVLKPHKLKVCIKSALNYARQFKRSVGSRTQDACFESLYIRKARHSYGWDIAPRLVGAGIWRPVRLEIEKPERWTEWYLYTVRLGTNQAVLRLDWDFETPEKSLEGFEAVLRMSCGKQNFEQKFVPHFVAGRQEIFLPDPQLWEPAGRGEPILYDTELLLIKNGNVVDCQKRRFGIRTVDLEYREAHQGGEKFVFKVNGKPLYIKGANWIPVDAVHGEHPELIKKKLELFQDMHCNMVRCWGGGVYEDEEFFEWCDENGVLIWQDFMFACEIPPQNEWYLREVAIEAESIIKKLRHHPSLALWSGDNECDMVIRSWNPKVPPSYNRITREVLCEAVRTHDPIRDYLPSSPYVSDEAWRNKSPTPEQHLWGDRFDWRSTYYTCENAVFASEMGYPSAPSAENIRKFIPNAQVASMLNNQEWNCHASQQFGDLNGPFSFRVKLLRKLVFKGFGYIPETLEEFTECSQIVQAEAMKSFVERFRLNKWNKTGLIWWNMRDCWPQFSDAVVGYYFDRKLAYHYIKNSQQEFCMMCEPPSSWWLKLHAANDSKYLRKGNFQVSDLGTGKLEYEGSYSVAADSSACVANFSLEQGKNRLLKIVWDCDGQSFSNHYLMGTGMIDLKYYRKLSSKIFETGTYVI